METRRKNKRLKSYNYTEKRERLKKNILKIEKGLLSVKSQSELLQLSGYSVMTSTQNRKAIPDLVEEIYPAENRLQKLKELGLDRDDIAEHKKIEIETIKELNKLQGSYSPSKLEHSGSIDTNADELKEIANSLKGLLNEPES
jgi:predicted HTH domain antitoxin